MVRGVRGADLRTSIEGIDSSQTHTAVQNKVFLWGFDVHEKPTENEIL